MRFAIALLLLPILLSAQQESDFYALEKIDLRRGCEAPQALEPTSRERFS
jgi:hypothetical protein